MLSLGLNDKSPLRLLAHDISLLLLSFRTDDSGRTYAAVGATIGADKPRDVRLYDGDVIELVGRRSGTHRLRVNFTRSTNCMLRLTEVAADAHPKARLAARIGPAAPRQPAPAPLTYDEQQAAERAERDVAQAPVAA